MMTSLAPLVVLVAIVGQVSGVYVNIRAIHANGGRRGGGERVIQIKSNTLILSSYQSGSTEQKLEKLDQPNSNKFLLYKYGDISNRFTMLTSTTSGLNDVGLQPEKSSGDELLKQQFVLNGKKNQILCNGGERINGRLYTLQYREDSQTIDTSQIQTQGVCTDSGGNGWVPGAKCVFPFQYEETMHNECIPQGEERPWCYTVPNSGTGDPWGHCVPCQEVCTDSGGNGWVPGTKCVFPFQYEEKLHGECIPDGEERPWCYTVAKSGKGDPWGHCTRCSKDTSNTKAFKVGVIGCASNQDEREEQFEIVSTKQVTFNRNQFFLLNKNFPNKKLGIPNSGSSTAYMLNEPYSAKTLWSFEGVAGLPGKYRIKNVAYGKTLRISGSVSNGAYSTNWYFEKVEDNPGDQWDYYRIISNENKKFLPDVTGNSMSSYPKADYIGTDMDREVWRLVPRYAAKDEGYIELHRERGNPNDVSITTSWEMGLVKTSSKEMSTTTGVEVTLEMAVEKGPFSASLSSTVTHEISQSTSSSSEQSWSTSTSITRKYPANKDCTLYQRKVSYSSLIYTDGLSQTPRDFKMVCVNE